MSLQDVFYILGIVVMSLSLIILLVLTAAVLVIRNKINHLHQAIEDKLSFMGPVADIATTATETVKKVIGKRR